MTGAPHHDPSSVSRNHSGNVSGKASRYDSGNVSGNAARNGDHIAKAAREAARGARRADEDPEPSLGRRLGQIGVLGWTIVLPALLGIFAGRTLDRFFGTRIFFTAPLLLIGAGCGFWLAWRWMRRQQRSPDD